MSWFDGARVDDQAARGKDGDGVRAIWGGQPGPGDQGHGEIISHDGLNANYVREPGGEVIVDDLRADPYEGYQSQNPRHNFP